jgi:hypothetical protein
MQPSTGGAAEDLQQILYRMRGSGPARGRGETRAIAFPL